MLLHLGQNITFFWCRSIANFKIKMKVNISSQFKYLVVFFNVIFEHICNDYLVLPPLFSYSKEAHMVRYLKITLSEKLRVIFTRSKPRLRLAPC